MANKSRLGLKLVLLALVIAAAVVAGTFFLRPVAKVAVVSPGKAVNSVNGSVVVVATRSSSLTSEIGGRVLKNDLESGKEVKEGDVLVQIDTGDIDLDIEKIQNDLKAAKQRVAAGSASKFAYETEVENLQNAERQYQRGGLSEQDLVRQKRAVQNAKLRLDLEGVADQLFIDNLENSLKVKQRQREKMTLIAPFDGVVAAVFAHKDDLIGPNTTIATLITLSRRVEAKISEENFASVQLGQRAKVNFLTYGDAVYQAKVVKKLPTADAGTQRYVVQLEVEIDPAKLLPDLTGDVNIIVAERDSQTIVPRRALLDRYVWVVKNGRVERRRVSTGYTALNSAEVLEGLQPGDLVIIEELDKFSPGDRVRTEVVNAKF